MELTLLNIIIVYVVIVATYTIAKIMEGIKKSTYTPLLDTYISNSIQYARNITWDDTNSIVFGKLGTTEQNKIIGHSIGYMKLNHKDIMYELGIDDKNNEQMCSLIVSRIK